MSRADKNLSNAISQEFSQIRRQFWKKKYTYISDSSWHPCGLGIPARTWRALTRNNSQDYSRISIPNLEAIVQLDDKWASFPTNRETSWIFLSFRQSADVQRWRHTLRIRTSSHELLLSSRVACIVENVCRLVAKFFGNRELVAREFMCSWQFRDFFSFEYQYCD